MLNELQSDIRELIELTRKAENYDATIAAMLCAGKPIIPGIAGETERQRQSLRIRELRLKWNI